MPTRNKNERVQDVLHRLSEMTRSERQMWWSAEAVQAIPGFFPSQRHLLCMSHGIAVKSNVCNIGPAAAMQPGDQIQVFGKWRHRLKTQQSRATTGAVNDGLWPHSCCESDVSPWRVRTVSGLIHSQSLFHPEPGRPLCVDGSAVLFHPLPAVWPCRWSITFLWERCRSRAAVIGTALCVSLFLYYSSSSFSSACLMYVPTHTRAGWFREAIPDLLGNGWRSGFATSRGQCCSTDEFGGASPSVFSLHRLTLRIHLVI